MTRDCRVRTTSAIADRLRPVPPGSTKGVELDRRALIGDLRDAVRGEVRFDAASRALYATDASNYRQVPDRRRRAAGHVDDVDRRGGRVRAEHGAPCSPRGGGTSLAGQCSNVAVVIDFSKYLHRVARASTRARDSRACEPGVVLDDLLAAAEDARPHVRPDPVDARPLHARRHDRQQLVRRALGSWRGRDRGQRRGARRPHLRRRADARRADLRGRARRDPRAGGRRGRDPPRGCASCATATPTRSASASPTSRGAFPATTSTSCCPSTASTSRARSSAPRGPASLVLEATVRLVDQPAQRARSLVLGFRRRLRGGATTSPSSSSSARSASRGSTTCCIFDMREKGLHPARRRRSCPDGGGWLLVEFGGDHTARGRRAGARACMERSARRGGRAAACALRRPRQEQASVWTVRESGLGATARVPGQTPTRGRAGRTRPSRPSELGDYLRDLRELLDRLRLRGRAVRPLRSGLRPHAAIDFDLTTAAGIAKYRALHARRRRDLVVALRRLALRRARRRPGARASCSETMFGPGARRRVRASSSRSGTRAG